MHSEIRLCACCRQHHSIEAELFQNIHKLHLTLGTLVLMSEEEVKCAVKVLRQCYDDLAV